MDKEIRFYKEGLNWFADIPNYPGSKEDLQMISGADTMLDYFAEDKDIVNIHFKLSNYEGYEVLEFQEYSSENQGAYYILKTYKGIEFNLKIWLCEVTKFVFGYFPENIYFNARLNVF